MYLHVSINAQLLALSLIYDEISYEVFSLNKELDIILQHISLFSGEAHCTLIYVLPSFIELYKGTLHLDRSIKVRSQSYQSRW